MTRLERKESELDKLYEYRAAALKSNDLMWLSQNRDKIDALEKEVIALRSESRRRLEEHKKTVVLSLTECLEQKSPELKAEFYVAIFRISMLADAVNEACEVVNTLMESEFGAVNFSLKKEVKQLVNLSRQIASYVCRTGAPSLQDCIVDNEKFVDNCMKLATKHITSKLKIKTK